MHAKMCSLCMLNKCRLEPVATSGHMAADPVLPDSVKPVAADSAEDLNPQGFDLSLIRSAYSNWLFPLFALVFLSSFFAILTNPFLKQEQPLLLLSGLLQRG